MTASRLLKILFPIDIKSLTVRQRIYHILIFTVPLLLFLLLPFSTSFDFFYILLWLLYVILFAPWYCYLLAYEKLEKKYNVESEIRFGNSYEFFSKFMVFFVPGILISTMTIAYLADEIFLGLVISSAFIIPSLGLFFRDGVFNDENCIEGEDTLIGYNPGGYGLLSVAMGLFGYITAFKLNSPTMSISLIITTLVFQTLAIAPDIINKVLFIDVRRMEGYLLLLFSLGALFLFICTMIIGHPAIDLNNVDLSFEGIARKTITWATAIVLAILFARKIKSMTRK